MMTRTAQDTSTPTTSQADRAAADLGGFEALAATGTAWGAAFHACTEEMARFLAHRLDRDMQAQQALLACRDLDALREIQESFLREAINDYQEETGRLAEIGRDFWQAAMGAQSRG